MMDRNDGPVVQHSRISMLDSSTALRDLVKKKPSAATLMATESLV